MTRVDRQPRWRSGDLVDVRGVRCRIDETESWPDCVALRLVSVDSRSATRTLIAPFDRPRPVDRRHGVRTVKPRRWRHTVRRVLVDAHPFGGLRCAALCQIRLLPHQLEPALAVLRHGTTRVLIADGVGLGKTIQAGLIVRELASRSDAFRGLVLVPAGLRDQWARELATHFEMPAVQSDAAWLRTMTTDLPCGINPWSMPGVYIASMDFAKRAEVLQPIEEVTWDVCVVDEAHLAATGTDRRAAVHAIASRSHQVLLLTATPHDGDAAEFEGLTRIGSIGEEASPIVTFRRSRADVSGAQKRRTVILKVTPSSTERRMHELLERYTTEVWNEALRRRDARARLMSIVLRKRALSSAASLAASVRRRLEFLDATPGEEELQLSLPLADEDPIEEDVEPSHALGAPGLTDGHRERRWLNAIAQAASNAAQSESKVRRLLRLLARLREPFILFTEYRDTLHRLERIVAGTGRQVLVLHGGMEAGDRRRVQDRFNRGGMSLLATDAASEGLNLHHQCRLVVHYELPWSASRIEQRAGRVDRLGQARRVHEIALVASDTAERLVLAPLARRAAQVGATRQDAAGLLALLTEPRITEAIFGTAIPSVAPPEIPQDPVRSMDLRIEAAVEVERVEKLRATLMNFGRTGVQPTVFTVIRRPVGLPAGLALVVLVTLRDSFGRSVHAEAKVVHLADWTAFAREPRIPSSTPLENRAALLAFLRSLEGTAPTALGHTLRRLARNVLRKIDALHAQWLDTRREREGAMLAALPSAAARLVQAGLFDRRALRQLAHRRETTAIIAADASAVLDRSSGATLTADVDLVAAALITRGAG